MTRYLIGITSGVFLVTTLAVAQIPATGTAPSQLSFEVASIKPAPPLDPIKMAQQMREGIAPHLGMKVDQARVDIGYMSLADLIGTAYKVKRYQLSGPDFMNTQRFDILAKLPEGATKEQVPEMLQALLAERFKLAIHHESKEQQVFELTVGKNGPKLKESPPDPETPPSTAGAAPSAPTVPEIKNDGNGRVTVNAGQAGTMHMQMTPTGQMRIEASKMTMAQFADTLTQFLGKPVVDKTGLKGNYQVSLDLTLDDLRAVAASAGMNIPIPPSAASAAGTPAASASDPSGSAIFSAIQELGLKLDSKKDPMDFIVVDRLEKMPTEN